MTQSYLDATNYRWKRLNGHSPFGILEACLGKTAVGSVEFTKHSLNACDMGFGYHGEGELREVAAMLLSDDTILFCMVSGYCFTDTNSPSKELSMRYYIATPKRGK